ncbi:MAG: APC family permease [Legionellaceae bacterium]|nr:APC family permease [Legionellaceae bacterium]
MLKRDISRINILIASAGGMVGSGWLFSPFISAQIAGSNALISWVLAAVFMLFVALPLCELGTMFPISGGMTNYPSFTHGDDVGFLFAWTSWLSYVVMTPIEIQAIMQYSGHLFPSLVLDSSTLGLSPIGYVVAISIMFFVVVMNSFGIKLLAQCNTYASIIKFLMPAIAIISLISISPSFNHIQLNLTDKTSWSQIFSALSVGGIAFAFTGFQNGLMLAGEVENPQRNIPIAILGAVLIGFILYFMLQWSFLVAIPDKYLQQGWQHLHFPGDSGPLVGLTVLVGLTWVASLLAIDAVISPFGTTLVYTAATSRILYGMALNNHLPAWFTKLNRYQVPYLTLYANFLLGALSFLPFPGWQKMVAFLSSCSILSYGIGPICLLAMRKLQPDRSRPFKLSYSTFFCHIAFYVCNLMLYWCGFEVLWKLDLALFLGLAIHLIYHRRRVISCGPSLYWFVGYMFVLLILSYLGSFGGIGTLKFPFDVACILPLSILILYSSQSVIVKPAKDLDLMSYDIELIKVDSVDANMS